MKSPKILTFNSLFARDTIKERYPDDNRNIYTKYAVFC